jgi:hypothetical protein
MSWRDSLTDTQRDLVSRHEAAYNARRIATRNTPDCVSCEGFANAGGAWWLDQAIYCPCENGQRVKALDAERRAHLNAKAAAADQAEATRRAKACTRCGGSGMYGHYGSCFRCNGIGVDPKYLKGAI